MAKPLRWLLAAPVFEDEEKSRVARLLNTVLLAFLASALLITLTATALFIAQPDAELAFTLLSGVAMTVIIAGLIVLARFGHLRVASFTVLAMSWALITIWIYGVAGISTDSSALVYVLLTLLAGLLLGGRAALSFTAASVGAVLGAYFAETTGMLVVLDRPVSPSDPLFIVLPLAMAGSLLYYAVQSMNQALERARNNERAQIEANCELESLQVTLEQRVAERTGDLERRSTQLQAAAEVSRAATSILDTEQLIQQAAELIQERFDLYHVGLFVRSPGHDATGGEWAVYRAGAGEAAPALVEQGFRLQIGGPSMVGWSMAHAQTRVAQDVKLDEIYMQHELVAATRAEAALPLIARGEVLGALSVQSDRPGAFDPDTVAALQTMADQLAVALDNARLFAESQQALEATRRAYGEVSRQAWARMLSGRLDWGYTFERQSVVPSVGDWRPVMIEAVQTGQPVVQGAQAADGKYESGETSLAIPLQVRGQVVGALGFYKDSTDGAWTLQEQGLLRRLVDQLGLALENAQLFEDTQRRASREQAIRHVTDQMRRSVDVETILQNTVAELAKALGAPRAYVRLGTEAELRPRTTVRPQPTDQMAGGGAAPDLEPAPMEIAGS